MQRAATTGSKKVRLQLVPNTGQKSRGLPVVVDAPITYAALAEELDRADKNDDVRVVLVYGAGDSFTAGNPPSSPEATWTF